MTTIFLFVGGYFVLLGVLSVAVRPARSRLGRLANEILCDTESEAVRQHVQEMLRTAYSIRTAPAQLFWILLLLVVPAPTLLTMAQEAYQEHPDVMDEGRLPDLYELYRASAAAVNPIFGALAYAARLLFRIKIRICARRYHADRRRLGALQFKAA